MLPGPVYDTPMESLRTIRISSDTILRFFLIGIGIYGLFLVRNIVVLILAAIVIASFVEFGIRWLARFKIRRTLAVSLIYSVSILILAGVFYAFVPIVFRELSGLLTVASSYLPSTINTDSLEGAGRFADIFSKENSINDILMNIRSLATTFSAGFTSIIGGTFGSVLNLILVIVMSLYLSVQERGIETFLRILTPVKYEKNVISLWVRTQHKIGLWFQGQLILGVIVGTIVFVGLALFGVQYSFLLAVIAGLFELIPFGIIFAAIPAILFSVIDGGLLLSVKIAIFYIIVQQIENYVLVPLVVKRLVGIPPLIVLLSFLIGISLAGFWGAILAMPIAVFVLEYLADMEKNKLQKVTVTSPLEK